MVWESCGPSESLLCTEIYSMSDSPVYNQQFLALWNAFGARDT